MPKKKKEKEHIDFFIKIDRSINIVIDENEAKELFKKDVYFTKWTFDWWDLYIFDLEKDSVIPELRFIDWFSWRGIKQWFNFFWPWFLFIIVLVWIFLYFNFLTWPDEKEWNINNNVVSSILPVSNNTWSNSNEPFLITSTWTINIPESVESKNSNFDLETKENEIKLLSSQLFWQENSNMILWAKNDLLNLKLLNYKEDLNICESKIESLKVQNNVCFDDKTNLENKLRLQTSLNLEDNQLFLSIWKDVFERCEKRESDYCSNYLYEFYNLRN